MWGGGGHRETERDRRGKENKIEDTGRNLRAVKTWDYFLCVSLCVCALVLEQTSE